MYTYQIYFLAENQEGVEELDISGYNTTEEVPTDQRMKEFILKEENMPHLKNCVITILTYRKL